MADWMFDNNPDSYISCVCTLNKTITCFADGWLSLIFEHICIDIVILCVESTSLVHKLAHWSLILVMIHRGYFRLSFSWTLLSYIMMLRTVCYACSIQYHFLKLICIFCSGNCLSISGKFELVACRTTIKYKPAKSYAMTQTDVCDNDSDAQTFCDESFHVGQVN